ncbi:hypothetical protein Tamer19_38150 [Cupriavidus sp. TA19]|uniref:protoglobin domain-containing protein n=1 Tax=unclassified Cupriavidus TaxID=2640874 RepID=UPI000E2E6A8E|nr:MULTISPECIES: protoglobin domain-containing protein [unclassified Cupriavidus]BDB29716.1 protogloblin ApPgb [Cupriavidus sp. P-10]GLC94407.1 hypothetical protein Tamer19_38150 [Cupriavidus sp. TA19]
MSQDKEIPGYLYGSSDIPSFPITMTEFELMKKSVLFGDEDAKFLRLSHDVLKEQVEAILDVWYGFVASNPHLVSTFASQLDGSPLGDYLAAVRKRFGQWILDTARAEYDQAWLDYQYEIGRRHHRIAKNRTDGVAATSIVPFRDLFLLIYPITHTLWPFLAKHGHSREDVEAMHAAWVKTCLLQATLWSYSYVSAGDF